MSIFYSPMVNPTTFIAVFDAVIAGVTLAMVLVIYRRMP